LVIKHKGELVTFCLTKGNVDDRKVMPQLMKNLKGLAAADKGYISESLAAQLQQHDLKLITKVRSNMKKKIYSAFEKFFLKKRGDMATLIRTGKLKYYEPGVFTKCPIKNLKVILLNLSRRQLN